MGIIISRLLVTFAISTVLLGFWQLEVFLLNFALQNPLSRERIREREREKKKESDLTFIYYFLLVLRENDLEREREGEGK